MMKFPTFFLNQTQSKSIHPIRLQIAQNMEMVLRKEKIRIFVVVFSNNGNYVAYLE